MAGQRAKRSATRPANLMGWLSKSIGGQQVASQTTLLGAAGEYFVMSELLRRGYIAALAPVGVPNADIVVTDLAGQKLSAIQVKARRAIGSDNGWHMSSKHERIISSNLFYCFVDFGKTVADAPRTYVIPSAIVAEALKKSYIQWLLNPGKNGRPHKDHDMRRLQPNYSRVFLNNPNPYPDGWMERFRSAWNSLGEPQQSVDVEPN